MGAAAQEVRELPTSANELLAEVMEADTLGRCLPSVVLVDAGLLDRPGAPERRRVRVRRVMLAFDSSGSMAARLGRGTRMEEVREAAERFLGRLQPEVEVGLVVLGRRGNARQEGRAASCRGAEAVLAPDGVRRGLEEYIATIRSEGTVRTEDIRRRVEEGLRRPRAIRGGSARNRLG